MNPNFILAVAVGGAIGSVLRYLVAIGSSRALGAGLPWGILIINITGSFLIGAFVGAGSVVLSIDALNCRYAGRAGGFIKNLMLSWVFWALHSAEFAGLTAIFAKIGIENVNSDIATFIRTIVGASDACRNSAGHLGCTAPLSPGFRFRRPYRERVPGHRRGAFLSYTPSHFVPCRTKQSQKLAPVLIDAKREQVRWLKRAMALFRYSRHCPSAPSIGLESVSRPQSDNLSERGPHGRKHFFSSP
jgi:hypothetical protein